MVIDSNKHKHPLMRRADDIGAMVEYWDMVEDIVEGYSAIKAQGEKYLPRFPGEDSEDYKLRLENTKFTNIYRDVLEGLSSKPFEDEVKVLKTGDDDTPQQILDFVEDVNGAGSTLSSFSTGVFFNGINNGIDWIMVDHPVVDTALPMTVKQKREAGITPFWTRIIAKNVLEVKSQSVESKEVITYFRLLEPEHGDTPDRVRVYERDVDGFVGWELFEYNENATKPEDAFISIETGEISIGVIPFVPFITGRRDGSTYKLYPPMRDAADLQITLYKNESALESIKTLTAYPMLAANGMKPQKEGGKNVRVAVGPMKVLYGLPDGQGNHGEWKFIEPNANSMEFLKKDINSTKQDLRELGRQPLTALSSQLTTVTTSVAAGKAKSAVTAWALNFKDSLENALELTALWMGIEYKATVHVFTGFDDILDNGHDIDALNKARDRGDLSQQTYLQEYKRRKILSPDFNFDSESKRLLDEIPFDNVDEDVQDIDNNV